MLKSRGSGQHRDEPAGVPHPQELAFGKDVIVTIAPEPLPATGGPHRI